MTRTAKTGMDAVPYVQLRMASNVLKKVLKTQAYAPLFVETSFSFILNIAMMEFRMMEWVAQATAQMFCRDGIAHL